MFNRILLRLALGLAVSAASAQAAISTFVRPDFENLSGPASVSSRDPNPGLIWMQGLITTVAKAPTDGGGFFLTEASFGQPFSPYIFPLTSDLTDPTNTLAAEVLAQVQSVLYPPHGATRAQVLGSTDAFRYKWLLFSPNPGEVDVTSHFQNMSNWYGDPERAIVSAQILVLEDAIAVSPLDIGLRDALLDCYYDTAVAEMQFSKQDLDSLAARHLGLTSSSPFAIDDEISLYQSIVTREASVLQKYSALLAMTSDGVDPSDFDPRVAPGTPMGLYIFEHEQPYRNQLASEYAGTNGTEVIPAYDTNTLSAVPRLPNNLVLYSGFKDYTTLLQIMGQYIEHQSNLARLLGMRQGPNDLTQARNAISQVLGGTANDFQMLQGMFTNVFLPGDASGVDAAVNGVQTALGDITGIRNFVNGTANMLGLDPNFLLLVQGNNTYDTGYLNDSFDVLLAQYLTGPNLPLGDALAKLATATVDYNTFRASVDQVVAELGNVSRTYQDRYRQITGYNVDDVPGFAGFAKTNSGSDLDVVSQQIASLQSRNETLKTLTAEINQNLAEATAAVTVAQGLDGKIDSATATYISTASSAYDTIAKESGLAAASQAVTDGTIAIAGLPLTDEGSGDMAILAAAGLNAAAQGLAQGVIANRQGDIDIAAVQLQSAQTKADNALTVNQVLQTLSNVRQQANANQLATTDNNLTLAAALAQQTALQQELVRIAQKQADDRASVRSSYYADPIHYIRSENSLMLADSAFANAQRWVFYAQRALEYKWEEKFASTESSGQEIRTFDSGTIFKLRNATELNDLLTQLVNWNNVRMSQDSRVLHTSFISALNDILAPNPNVANATPTNRVDTFFRVDLKTSELVSQLELFHRLLTRGMDASGNLNIDFDTTHLDNLQADFFVGPNYTSSPIAPGEWRDKIIYLKFNIVATDGTSIPQNVAGSISYGGQTFFRTRIPPCPNRSVHLPAGSADGLTPTEVPGEFVTAPFQLFYSKNYNNLFLSRDTQNQSVTVAYTGATAKSPTGGEILGNTYQNNSFNQRSVAATRWRLTLFAPPTGWDVTKFKDIEIIVNHASSDRQDPTCP